MGLAHPTGGASGLTAPTGQAGAAAADLWTTDLDLDLSALATVDLDHTAGSVTIDGDSWTQVYGSTALDDLDLVNGTGLVADMSAANSVFNTDTPTVWTLTRAFSDIIADFDPDMVVEVCVRLSALGDAASEMHGVVVRSTSGTSYAAAVMLGHNGTAKAARAYRQNGATATQSSDTTGGAVTAADCVRLVGKRYNWTAYFGASVGGDWPADADWTRVGGLGFNISASAADAWTAPLLGFVAQTGNTSNNFAPAWPELRVRHIAGSEV